MRRLLELLAESQMNKISFLKINSFKSLKNFQLMRYLFLLKKQIQICIGRHLSRQLALFIIFLIFKKFFFKFKFKFTKSVNPHFYNHTMCVIHTIYIIEYSNCLLITNRLLVRQPIVYLIVSAIIVKSTNCLLDYSL